ncbi:NAD-dependent epimerase/dehydratase family protein [Elusimicrobiota bacterium]
MAIFVTGATGNTGRFVIPELAQRGLEAIAMMRKPEELPGCRGIKGDLLDIDRLAHEITRADAVIHLASPRTNDREIVLKEDINGTAKLLDHWAKGNFIYMSSQTVYGIPGSTLTESSPLKTSCWYDLGKVCNEFQVSMAGSKPGRGFGISLRMALLFGDGIRRNDRQFLPGIVEQCRMNKTFVFDSGEGLETYGSSFIGGRDLARAIVDSLDIKVSGAFNVAGAYTTWKQLISTLNDLLGTRSDIIIRKGAKPGPKECRLPQSRSYLDTTAFKTQTGFIPKESLEQTLKLYLSREP